MNLSKIREIIQAKTGFPDRGSAGTARLNTLINHGLTQLHGDMPEVLLREEFRFTFEVPVKIEAKLNVLTTDPLVMTIGPFGASAADATLFAEDYTGSGSFYRWRARDIDITDSAGDVHSFKIQDLEKAAAGPQFIWRIYLSRPWFNTTDTNLTAQVYTYEYPYPADTIRVRRVIIDPEGNASDVQFSSFPDAHASRRIQNGWKEKGTPLVSARGDYFQLEPPHYVPAVSTAPGAADPSGIYQFQRQWGYDGSWLPPAPNTLVENRQYGLGGQFSYVVAHVWGRRIPANDYSYARTQEGNLLPFYISAHSKPSAKVSTKWGAAAIQITTPDLDYVYGYTNNSTLESYHHNGVEKWIFRARHTEDQTLQPSTPAHNGSLHTGPVEVDDVYYLWKIVPGYETVTFDVGDQDPVDRRFQLIDSAGHNHIRFDYLPSEDDDVLMSVIRRPHELNYDTDVPRLPPECMEALISLVCSYVAGERDGSAERVSMYKKMYEMELRKLRSIVALDSHVKAAFGEGLSSGVRSALIPGPLKGW